MYKYTIKRVLLMIPTLIGAAILVFALLRLIPGDVCMLRLAGDGAFVDQAAIDQCRIDTGIADPFIVQFGHFLVGMFTFDFGTSMWTGQPVTHEIALRFKLSLEIAIMATVVSIAISIPLGTISAIKQNTWIDYVVRSFSILGIAVPSLSSSVC